MLFGTSLFRKFSSNFVCMRGGIVRMRNPFLLRLNWNDDLHLKENILFLNTYQDNLSQIAFIFNKLYKLHFK